MQCSDSKRYVPEDYAGSASDAGRKVNIVYSSIARTLDAVNDKANGAQQQAEIWSRNQVDPEFVKCRWKLNGCDKASVRPGFWYMNRQFDVNRGSVRKCQPVLFFGGV